MSEKGCATRPTGDSNRDRIEGDWSESLRNDPFGTVLPAQMSDSEGIPKGQCCPPNQTARPPLETGPARRPRQVGQGKVMFLASKIVWAGIALTLPTTGVSTQGLPRSPAGSDSERRSCSLRRQNEIRKLFATKDTTRARPMAFSAYGPEPVFARIRRRNICQSPGGDDRKWPRSQT